MIIESIGLALSTGAILLVAALLVMHRRELAELFANNRMNRAMAVTGRDRVGAFDAAISAEEKLIEKLKTERDSMTVGRERTRSAREKWQKCDPGSEAGTEQAAHQGDQDASVAQLAEEADRAREELFKQV